MRRSPSMVGRRIANPMSARTRGFKSPSPRSTHTHGATVNWTRGAATAMERKLTEGEELAVKIMMEEFGCSRFVAIERLDHWS
ncbi:hypothetical protein IBTHAUMO2_450036 [Nitrosopumilaceae archaeon]|nr:hypothetical protein IBTHAUMO2_450036 [Nitrosopumilaceae archaeon]